MVVAPDAFAEILTKVVKVVICDWKMCYNTTRG